MIVYPSIEALLSANGDQRKWQLVAQALANSAQTPTRWTRSLRDSLTYWVEEPQAPTGQEYLSSRAYQTVLGAQGGRCVLEIAEAAALDPAGPYDDQTDYQEFIGDAANGAERLVLEAGHIVVIGRGKAWRIAERHAELVHLRVTAAGVAARNPQ